MSTEILASTKAINVTDILYVHINFRLYFPISLHFPSYLYVVFKIHFICKHPRVYYS